MDGLIYSV